MATQFGQVQWTIIDDVGVRVAVEQNVSIDDTKTVADVYTDIGALQAVLSALTNGGFVRQHLTLVIPNFGGVSSTPTPDADGEEGAMWDFTNAVTPYSYGFRVPAYKSAILSGGKVNPSNTDVSNFEAAWTTAATNGTQPVNREYRNLAAVRETFLSNRKPGKAGLRERSLTKR